MKKFLAHVFALTLIVALATGCTPTAPGGDSPTDAGQAGGKIVVLLPSHEMDNKGFMEKETRNFEKESGVTVELINMGWDNVADRVMSEMSAGGSSYDVVEFDNSWVAKFINNKWVVPLDSYVTDEMKNGILPGLLNKFSSGGKIYGIAWNNDTRFFMYNKAKLDAAGIAAPPKTWAELKEQSLTLMDKGLAKYGFIDSYMQAQSGTNELTFAVYAHGGNFFDENNKLVVSTDPGAKAAYEFLADGLNTSKFIDPNSLTADNETVANTFCSGTTAFMLQAWPGVWDMAGDSTTSKIVGEIAVAPYSLSADGKTQSVLTLPEAMAIPTASKNKDNAFKYIQYMSSKEFDKRKALEIGALPIWTDLYSDPDLLALYPYWEQFGEQAVYARGYADIEWFDEFSNVVQIESQNILLGNVPVADGLKAIQDKCAEYAK